MNLIKTSLLSSIAVIIKILTLLGLNKILAIYVGPAGYALIGQLQNVITIVLSFSSTSLNVGITKYTAEYHDDIDKQHKVWKTATKLSLLGTFIISLIMFIFNQELALFFLKDDTYSDVFLWFAFTLILFVFNSLLIAIINGKKEIKSLVTINIIASIVSLIITSFFAFTMGIKGALIALVTNQSFVFFITFALCRRLIWFKVSFFWGNIDRSILIGLAKYSLMALVTAIVVPASHMLIRTHLSSEFGWESAGYWDASWRISTIYLMFITTTLGVYYLPRISEIKNKGDLKYEIMNGYKIILPFVILISFCIYNLREFIVTLLFTPDFMPMESLFFWQLTGDVFKIAGWLLAYIMLGKAMTKLYIISEILFAASFYGFTLIFTQSMGLEGVSFAYCVNYVIYFFFITLAMKRLGVI